MSYQKILKVLEDVAEERLKHGVPQEVVAERIAEALGKPSKAKPPKVEPSKAKSKKSTKKKK